MTAFAPNTMTFVPETQITRADKIAIIKTVDEAIYKMMKK